MQESKFLKLIGKRIAELRKKQRLTQTQLGDLCEMERSAIARLESGTENVTAATFYKLSKALNVPLKTFFDFEY
jgi:transcriptional regulator with XRE-family HTH domain